jgi:hypothetical protein
MTQEQIIARVAEQKARKNRVGGFAAGDAVGRAGLVLGLIGHILSS